VTLPFYTIGHSNRTLGELVAMLRAVDITLLVDIRKMTRSRTNPQFNEATLPDALAAADIGYEHIAELGGLRGKSRDVPDALNGFWTNRSFHRYADYALSPEFRAGLTRLIALGSSSAARSCVRRPSGGAVTGVSCPTTCSRAARRCCTSWA
jgi:uncharacterized protein (DUF488 family)